MGSAAAGVLDHPAELPPLPCYSRTGHGRIGPRGREDKKTPMAMGKNNPVGSRVRRNHSWSNAADGERSALGATGPSNYTLGSFRRPPPPGRCDITETWMSNWSRFVTCERLSLTGRPCPLFPREFTTDNNNKTPSFSYLVPKQCPSRRTTSMVNRISRREPATIKPDRRRSDGSLSFPW